jgi:XRE family transcriptional regulator, regulator of sulfur utilization
MTSPSARGQGKPCYRIASTRPRKVGSDHTSVKQGWTVPRLHREGIIVLELGPRLRAARKARQISVRALAQRTGFSPSFLSQVELGQSSPSLASLQRICDALEVDLPDLLRDPDHARTAPVVRRADRESLRSEWSKASAESLLPNGGDDRFAALLLTIDPGGRTGIISTRGSRELAYCIRGKVELTMGSERFDLSPGDSALIDRADASWVNRGKRRAEILVVSARVG